MGGGSLIEQRRSSASAGPLTPDDRIDISCRAAGRNMTREEWQQFSWSDEPYRRTCEEWPAATTT